MKRKAQIGKKSRDGLGEVEEFDGQGSSRMTSASGGYGSE